MVEPSKIVIVGIVVSVVYFLLKFMEMRFVDPENQKPVKVLVRDSIMVCISAVLGVFVLNQFEKVFLTSIHCDAQCGNSIPLCSH